MEISIRLLTRDDRAAWHRLWDAYCAFYETVMPAEVTATTWQRLLDESDPNFFGLVAERDGTVIGIANCVLHGTTWAISQRCYLNDLFVDPEVRGGGTGKALIEHLRQLGAANGWDKIHWLTAENNVRARRLYDQFAPASGFIQYAIPVQDKE
jgi:GNAT superfamily N-acetyltransferase